MDTNSPFYHTASRADPYTKVGEPVVKFPVKPVPFGQHLVHLHVERDE